MILTEFHCLSPNLTKARAACCVYLCKKRISHAHTREGRREEGSLNEVEELLSGHFFPMIIITFFFFFFPSKMYIVWGILHCLYCVAGVEKGQGPSADGMFHTGQKNSTFSIISKSISGSSEPRPDLAIRMGSSS